MCMTLVATHLRPLFSDMIPQREKFMLYVFCRYRARTVKRENRLGYDWNSNDLCCIDFG